MSHLHAPDWQVFSIPNHATAVRFLRDTHYAGGASNTSTYRHGLYRAGLLVSDVAGVALWIPPTRTAAESIDHDRWGGVLALSRLAVAEDVPTNGASFLLGRSMRLIDRRRWPILLTYADTAHGHTGAIYRATNWTCLGPVPAGDVWTTPTGQQVGRKRGGHTFTHGEMRDSGHTLVPAAPKIKFVHVVAS